MDQLPYLQDLPPAARVAVLVVAEVLLAILLHAAIYRGLWFVARRVPRVLVLDGALLRRSRGPTRLLVPLLAVRSSLPLLAGTVPAPALAAARHLLYVLLVLAVAWLLVALTGVLQDVVMRRYDLGDAEDLRARRVVTQVGLLRRVLGIGIGIFALGAILMRFEGLEAIGTGLLASAGLIGVVVGIAAQRPLGNLVAGVQIAFTQPIRVGDALVVEQEWGTVEEITLTYVVVRIWDERRLVLPIGHFLERPFQNWTRRSGQVVGTVFLYVDHTAPVEAIRAEFDRVVRASPLWDGKVATLQVTDTTERTVQLRGTMSAASAGRAWDLRCAVREAMIAWLQREHPTALPRVRVAPADPEADGVLRLAR